MEIDVGVFILIAVILGVSGIDASLRRRKARRIPASPSNRLYRAEATVLRTDERPDYRDLPDRLDPPPEFPKVGWL